MKFRVSPLCAAASLLASTAFAQLTAVDVQIIINRAVTRAVNHEYARSLGANAIRAVKPEGLLWVSYPKGGRTRGATDLPATPMWTKDDVLGEFTQVLSNRAVNTVRIGYAMYGLDQTSLVSWSKHWQAANGVTSDGPNITLRG